MTAFLPTGFCQSARNLDGEAAEPPGDAIVSEEDMVAWYLVLEQRLFGQRRAGG
jgi:hypothetical protein